MAELNVVQNNLIRRRIDMNNTIKNVLIFVVGAGIGSAATYKILRDKYALIAQEEIDSVKENFAKRFNDEADEYVLQLYNDMYKEVKETIEEEEAEKTIADEEPKKNLVYRRTLGRVDYSKIDPAENMSPPEDEPGVEAYAEYDDQEPYVISIDEFGEEMVHFDKLTIYYYEEDDTLADEQEEIIDDPNAIVGDESLTRFGDKSDDSDIVYVRNERISVDYEVIRLHKSYQESVLGMPPVQGRR